MARDSRLGNYHLNSQFAHGPTSSFTGLWQLLSPGSSVLARSAISDDTWTELTVERQQFFALRMLLGFVSTLCEAKFYRAVVDAVNERVGRYMLFSMIFSAGMSSASVGTFTHPIRYLG